MGVTEGDLQVYIDVDVILENCTINNYCYAYSTNDQHPPSNLLVYSTIQRSTIEITM